MILAAGILQLETPVSPGRNMYNKITVYKDE
ncbi:hypothetical protein BH11BAC5_BH11BAC5_39930 [soil metagenome]|jgi:hypothetical protein